MYGPDYVTHAFYRTQDNGIEVIDVLEGATQGDVCSTFFYSMMIHEFVKKVDAQTTPNCRGFTGFFVDDGNLVADHASMLLKVKYVLQEGPKVGYHLQTKKGALLLGLCDSYDEALGRKNAYVDLGISPDIIKIHPDNLRQLTDSPDIEVKSAEYGAKILGAYIGSEAYVTSQFQAKTQELREAAQKICCLKDNQMKCLLLTKCFSHKVTYLQRTHSPDTPGLANLLTEFTGFQKDIVCSMLNDPNHEWWSPNNLPDIIFRQMQLHIKDSGLGLGFQDEIANIAYVASIVDVLPTMRKFWPEIDADMDEDGGQHFQAFRRALRHVQNIVEDPNLDADFLRKLSRSDLVKAGETTVQNFLSSKIRSPLKSRFMACLSGDHLKWVQSLDSSTAGLWLTAMPKSTGTRMDSGSFTAALIIRFRLPAPYYVFGSARCTCYNRTLLDEFGYHLTMGCGKDGFRNKAHNAVQRILRDACVLSGYPTKLEERGAFQANNPDCNMRPDLTVIGAPIKGPVKLLLDVSITHPLGRGDVATGVSKLKPGQAMSVRATQKNNTYLNLCKESGTGFKPLIAASTSHLAPEFVKFVSAVTVKYSELKGIRHSVIKNYWLTRISVAIVSTMAESLRARSVNSTAAMSLLDLEAMPHEIFNAALSDCRSREGCGVLREGRGNVSFQKDIIDLQNLIDQDIGEDMGEDDDVSQDMKPG